MNKQEVADEMFRLEYGSRLYGTATPTSDTDYKVVFLPTLDSVLLGKRMVSFKERLDAAGNVITDDSLPMSAGGVETEYIPFQTFARDFVRGQTYALEMAWALYARGLDSCAPTGTLDMRLLEELVENFSSCDVHSMAGFAIKQTMDYVRRGERKAAAEKVLAVLLGLKDLLRLQTLEGLRLDDPFNQTSKVLDHVASLTELPIGTSVNNNRTMRTLELNGRSYLETTDVTVLVNQVQKLVDSYGVRSSEAAEKKVDTKSLMHAVRVYQQCIELLETGRLTFPRKNPEELLKIKRGETHGEELKAQLRELDALVLKLQKESTQRRRTPQLEAQAEQWLVGALRELYGLTA